MTEKVWASAMIHESAVVRGAHASSKNENAEEAEKAISQKVALTKKNKRLELKSPADLSPDIYSDLLDYGLPPPIFESDIVYFSESALEVLSWFDTGPAIFHPVDLLDYKTGAPLNLRYHQWVYVSGKDAFLPDQAEKIVFDHYRKSGRYRPATEIKDGSLALSHAALSGADLWVDQRLRDVFFVSDRLAQALDAAGMAEGLELRSCRIV